MAELADISSNDNDLCYLSAVQQRALIRARKLSAAELLEAYLRRIDRVNPAINAIVTLDVDGARAQAKAADAATTRGEDYGPLHGLVLAHKDLLPTAGMRTTFGSPMFRDFVSEVDSEPAVKMRTAGAIRLGKTNVPEMGAGSHTFNPVFGATRNPYDQTKTAGGSSGGAGAALASGLLSLADGSDMGGSLRNPASFNNVVGLRASVGRISRAPLITAWFNLSVVGAMGRTVADTALLHGVLSGYDAREPNSLPGDGSEYLAIAEEVPAESLAGLRIGWSRDLGGLPVDPAVTEVLERLGRPTLESLKAGLVDIEPDFEGAEIGFRRMRTWQAAQTNGAYYRENPDLLSENVRYDVEKGLLLTADQIYEAFTARTRLHNRMVELFDSIDILATPAVLLPPFPVHWTWPREVAGIVQDDYLGWMRGSWYVSATGLPCLSVPCGFTEDGLPVGLQLVGRNLAEDQLLRVAAAFEQVNPVWQTRPVGLD
ncbi:MAG: amidase family protein [Thermomicrobiales bacterium]